MSLYGKRRDVNLFKSVSRELLHNIIEQQIGYYKPKIDEISTNLYGEALNKTYTGPVLIKCFIERGDQDWKVEEVPDVKSIAIGLEDHDAAIQYYFEKVIQPTVIQNGTRISVPVIVSSPEKFKSIQTDGFMRDKNSKLMVPLITYKRDSIEKNRELGNKLDGNLVSNIQIFEQRYTKRNEYDNFSALQGTKPQIARSITVVPDYVTITYSCIVFTNYIEQNNKLVEGIQFASDSYWGDFSKFAFRTKIDSFSTTTILEQGDDRAVKSSFNIILNGYLIPDSINKELALTQAKIYDKTKIVFTTEIVNKLP